MTIDPGQSRVWIFLYREGVLSALAHDHVMVGGGVTGQVRADPEAPHQVEAELHLPVASLQVDPPEERAAFGLEGVLDDDDRVEIAGIMLSEAGLDAARFPEVKASLSGARADSRGFRLEVNLTVRGIIRTVPAEATVRFAGGSLTAEGAMEFRQSAFGITPYSALLGAIAVKDTIRVTFRIVARTPDG